MARAISLARRGMAKTSPNPMVGAVIVKADRVIGEGWHRGPGRAHAEVAAIEAASGDVRGSDMFVNLEPCVHQGRTPPCVDALISSGFGRVIVGMADPDSRVDGAGIRALAEAGIRVDAGVLQRECEALNREYRMHRSAGRPFVTYKAAVSLDGKVAAKDGTSRWITSPEARVEAHRLRARSDAICVGVGTVMADDPELTTRLVKGNDPIRVVIDTRGRTPATAKVLAAPGKTIIFTCEPGARGLGSDRTEVVVVPGSEGKVSIKHVLEELGRRQVLSLLLEGGPSLAASFMATGSIDRMVLMVAPKLLGGEYQFLGDWSARTLSEARSLKIESTRSVGADLMIDASFEGGE